MRIRIRSGKIRLFLILPLWCWLLRIILTLARKHGGEEVPDPDLVIPIIKQVKRFRRRNGSFVFVDAVSPKDDMKVKITI